jgi:hypothetical protein
MNNEPVAWMQVHYKDGTPTKFSKVQTWEDDIPLYTHEQITSSGFLNASEPIYPAKTLTDEEIMLVSDEFKGIPVTSVDAWNKVILLFARAILRKAQEK